MSNEDVKVQLADYEQDKSFTILTRQSSNRTSMAVYSIFSNRVRLLEDLLKGEQNDILKAFRIKGANTGNYMSYQ